MHKSKLHSGEAGRDSQARDHFHTSRLTKSESAELAEHAAAAGLSVSQLVRKRALGQPAPQAAAPPANLKMYDELAGTASNLNQLTHHLNQVQVAGQAQVIDLAATRALLQKLLFEVAQLRADLLGGK